jgi:ring-1,2-phenylacetyl-CoA epoxidase subunit PaaC
MTPQVEYLLRIGDSTLILGQRLSEWCGHAPVLEEDIALANIALDLIGQSRLVLTHASELEGEGRDEDQLAFLRPESQFRNVTLAELPNGDFGRTVMKSFLFCTFLRELWAALASSTDGALAAIAGKSLKESRYHVQHAGQWVIRLGDGTDESHGRMQAALDALWPYTAELFTPTAVDETVRGTGAGIEWASLRGAWEAAVLPVLRDAKLEIPAPSTFLSRGKFGVHSEHMGHLLTEMQYLQRAYPGATW